MSMIIYRLADKIILKGQKAKKGWLEPLHPRIDNEIIHAAIVGEEMVENESDTGATR